MIANPLWVLLHLGFSPNAALGVLVFGTLVALFGLALGVRSLRRSR